jgi:hypothetical protein
MVLRTLRRITAGVAVAAAIAFAPSAARADTQILVQEVDGGGNVVAGSTQIFASSTNITTSLSNFSTVTITANPNSGAISSLTSTVNATPISSGFDPSIGLRVVVTSNGFSTPNVGGTAVVTNNASASSAIGGGQNQLTSNTQLLTNPLSTLPSSSTGVAAGTALGAATGVATDVRPSGAVSQQTTANVTSFPASFAIQQTITARAINVTGGGVASGSTLGGSASSLVSTTAAPGNPVPAPGGLALALVGLPLLGMRRALRKKA